MAEETIDRLIVEIDAQAKTSGEGMDKLIGSIERLRNAMNTNVPEDSGIGGVISRLFNKMRGTANEGSINGLIGQLNRLKEGLKGMNSAGNGVNALADGIQKLKQAQMDFAGTNLSGVFNELSRFRQLSDVSNTIHQVGTGMHYLADATDFLLNADLEKIQKRFEELTGVLRPFIEEMARAGAGTLNFGTQMKQFSDFMQSSSNMQMQFSKKSRRSKSGTGGLFKSVNLASMIYVFKNVAQAAKKAVTTISGYVEKMSDYVENVNLFTVSMGQFTQEAAVFTSRIQNELGFDSGEAMRYMGVFQQLSTSFGVASDRAYILSKNLTQLGYDFASFFNLKTEDAFQKLQSGITGEIEPLRRLGIDISNVRLQQELYNLGINASVENLSQADKETLRYIAIMKQANNVTGDAARTIMSPANALRVLQSQLQVTARQIGSIFIPALNAILPYAIAVVKVIGELAARLAAFLGFEMPSFDVPETNLPSVSEDLDNVGNAAQDAAKKMNFLIGGFDELNRLEAKNDAASSLDTGNLLDNIQLPEYDMFEGLIGNDVDKIVDRINDALKRLKDTLMGLGLKDVIDKFGSLFKTIQEEFSKYDFATQIEGMLANGFRLAMQVILAGLTLLEPMIPGIAAITFEIVKNLNSFFGTLADRINELLPRFEELGEIAGGFLEEFAAQISEHDFGEALANALGNALSFALSTLILAGKTVLPIVLALHVPDIFFETIETVSELFAVLDEAVRAVTPGLENFVQIGLVPIAKWLGEKIVDKLNLFQDNLRKIGDWFKEHTEQFTNLGTALGETADSLWELIRPLTDPIWDGFSGTLSKIVDLVLVTAETFTILWTWAVQAAGGIYDFFNIGGIASSFINGIISPILLIIEAFQMLLDIISGVGTAINGVLTGDWGKIKEGFGKIGSGIWDGAKDSLAIFNNELKKEQERMAAETEKSVSGAITGAFGRIPTTVKPEISNSSREITSWYTQELSKGLTENSTLPSTAASGILANMNSLFDTKAQTGQGETSPYENGAWWAQSLTQGLQDNSPAVLEQTQTLYNSMDESYKQYAENFKSVVVVDLQGVLDEYSSMLGDFDRITSDTMSSAEGAVSSSVGNMISDLRDLSDQIRITANEMRSMSSMKAGMGLAVGGMSFKTQAAYSRKTPALANGGVIRKPTYALVGEYAGASTDPEIVAPQSTIEESVVSANGQLVDAMFQMTQMMIAAFRSGQTISVQIDGREVGKASAEYIRGEERRTGKNPAKL